jgi:hypothetical protein
MTPAESEHDARQTVAAENRCLAEDDEREALYHAAMAVCLSMVGDSDEARKERSRATVLRRAAQIKREIAQKYDPQGHGPPHSLERRSAPSLPAKTTGAA